MVEHTTGKCIAQTARGSRDRTLKQGDQSYPKGKTIDATIGKLVLCDYCCCCDFTVCKRMLNRSCGGTCMVYLATRKIVYRAARPSPLPSRWIVEDVLESGECM